MTSTKQNQLRVFRGPETSDCASVQPIKVGNAERIGGVCAAFQQATGWPLVYVPSPPTLVTDNDSSIIDRESILAWSAPVNPGVGVALGHLKIELDDGDFLGGDLSSEADFESRLGDVSCGGLSCEWEAARLLAEQMADLFSELGRASNVLRDVQAELSLTPPVYARPATESDLSLRIEAVLRGGVEALSCQAAAMYLLDEQTTRLHLRSSYGIDRNAPAESVRELEGATADLEALVGNAVVLENDTLFELWNVPEYGYSAAVCVPIASPTTILGTFWMYSATDRDFSDTETNLIEILAGRLAIELEREMLLRQQSSRPT